MAVTIREIAQRAGVGVSTVSRVLNQSGYVGEAARERVLEAIRFYHYVPNSSARSLKAGAPCNIGLYVKGITNPFFSQMIHIIEEKCALRGSPLIVQDVDARENEMELAIREAQGNRLCGVILMGGSFTYTAEQFARLGVPCVLTTISAREDVPKEVYASVRVDDEDAGFRATEYLLSLGHRRIGFVYDPVSEKMTTNHLRFIGYKRALQSHGIAFDPRLVAEMPEPSLYTGYATGFTAARALRENNPDMTALFAFSDVLALGAMKGLFSLGLRVPEDVSVVGFDGIDAGEYYQPSLDTILQPAGEIARSSIEILFDMMQGGKPQHLICSAVLAKRGSAVKR